MKEKSGRRSFIKNVSMGSISAAILPAGFVAAGNSLPENEPVRNQSLQKNGRAYNAAYQGANLNRVAFPLGGLGAGMFCMEGTGAISHMSVRNRPEIFHSPSMFAAISVKGLKNGAKLLEGPVPDWKKFGQRSAGNGSEGATIGLPHFHYASFTAKFPFGYIDLSDDDIPLKIKVTGWSPFVPTEDNQSGLPVAAMEYQFTNSGKTTAEAVFSFNSKNFLKIDDGKNAIQSLEHGFVLTEAGTTEKPQPSSFAIFTDDAATVVDHCWFRGGWWDPLTMAWNSVKTGEAKSIPPVEKDAPGASLYVPFSIAPGKEKTIPG